MVGKKLSWIDLWHWQLEYNYEIQVVIVNFQVLLAKHRQLL